MPDTNLTPLLAALSAAGVAPVAGLGLISPVAALSVVGNVAITTSVAATPAAGSLVTLGQPPLVNRGSIGSTGALLIVGSAPAARITVAASIAVTPGASALSVPGEIASAISSVPLQIAPTTRSPAELNVDQTVTYAADQFEVALNDSAAFVTPPSFVTINLGLLDDLLAPSLVNAIQAAIVDEVELHASPDRLVSVIRGRDAAAYAVDSTVYVTYATQQAQAPPRTGSIFGFPNLPAVPGVTVPLVLPGPWTASRIATDLCSRVGLGCAYQAPDYVLREDVAVNGPILQAIQGLVEPFSHFERSKVDIWLENSTLIVRSRGEGGPGLTLNVRDTRITNLMVRSRFLGFIRVLRLTGSSTGDSFAVVDPGTTDTETTDELIDPNSGLVVSRVVTKETKRVLDGAVKRQVIETYKDLRDGTGLHLISVEEVTSKWDDLTLAFPNQVLNNPHESLRTTVASQFDPASGGLNPTTRTRIIQSYDANNVMSAQETIREDFDSNKGDWTMSSTETKQYRDNGAGMYQITTKQYASDGTMGDIRRTTALGSRPGGPGRGGPGRTGGGTPLALGFIVSTAPGAKDVSISNPSLLLAHLLVIKAQALAASGATEFEINFTAAGIPWLHRGQRIQLTGLLDENSAPIPLQDALVSEVKHEYRESGASPTFLSHVKALYWTP